MTPAIISARRLGKPELATIVASYSEESRLLAPFGGEAA
jgi:hypothetical protein